MRICDLNTGAGQLVRSSKRLEEKWDETKAYWNDVASCQFEEAFLRPLRPEARSVLAAIQRMSVVLEQAEKECEDSDRAG